MFNQTITYIRGSCHELIVDVEQCKWLFIFFLDFIRISSRYQNLSYENNVNNRLEFSALRPRLTKINQSQRANTLSDTGWKFVNKNRGRRLRRNLRNPAKNLFYWHWWMRTANALTRAVLLKGKPKKLVGTFAYLLFCNSALCVVIIETKALFYHLKNEFCVALWWTYWLSVRKIFMCK